jgi:hypothetical protein
VEEPAGGAAAVGEGEDVGVCGGVVIMSDGEMYGDDGSYKFQDVDGGSPMEVGG